MTTPKDNVIKSIDKAKADLERALEDLEHMPAFDVDGLGYAAHVLHNYLTVIEGTTELLMMSLEEYPDENLLPLNAGCCSICPTCAYLDDEPCRNPDQAVSSVEAYGINVIALQKSAGLPHYGGKNTVTYVGMILFDKVH